MDRVRLPPPLLPMLATAGEVPAGPGYGFEFKWDGVRALVSVAGDELRVLSRDGADVTGGYPELRELCGLLSGLEVTLDGEIVALGPRGVPSFARLQQRMHARHPGPALLARVPVVFYAFDVTHLGVPTLDLPYQSRRELLDRLAVRGSHVDTPPWFTGVAGADMLHAAAGAGLEGVVAKRLDSLYRPGRGHAWIKTALMRTTEAIVGGWTPGAGRRSATLGSLLLGMRDRAGGLAYVGNVGTGFSEATLSGLLGALSGLRRAASPFTDPVPREYARVAHWVRPELVADVRYRGWTDDHRLRHPVYRGLRPDRGPAEVLVPGLPEGGDGSGGP